MINLIQKSLTKLFGSKHERDIKAIQPIVEQIKEAEEKIKPLSNDELRARAEAIKQRMKEHVKDERNEIDKLRENAESSNYAFDEKEEVYDKIDELEKKIDEKYDELLEQELPEAFAIVRDTTRRFKNNQTVEVTANEFDKNLATKYDHVEIKGDKAIYHNSWMAGGKMITWDMVHYDVQLIGGVVLHQGKIAEMATGEGKTVAATLPIFLNALTGRGSHLVTVNDYLAKRDSEWMGPIYQFHGLSVDCIDKYQPNSQERRSAYHADITYGTNNEFGFDYLRDNMAINPNEMVQRKHNFAIVDEVDSVLIDDSRTPLIISGPIPQDDDNELFKELKPHIVKIFNAQQQLIKETFVEAKRLIKNGDTQNGGFKLLQVHKGMPKYKPLIKFLSEGNAKSLLQKTEDFYLQENAKRMPEVTKDLYFVIDEKNNTVELTDKGIDFLTPFTDDPEFFILPDLGSKLAELDKEELPEDEKLEKKNKILDDYAVKSERVHAMNQLLKAYTMFEKDQEYVVMDNKVKIVDEQTGRILEGRRYSDGLHQAIEAKENVKIEAATQTYASITLQNYFRMYHKLSGMTGTAETEAGEFMDIYQLDVVVIPTNVPVIRDDKEDMIYKTKREKYNAVIDETQEIINAGRAVLLGTTSVEVSELLSKMLKRKGIKHNVLNAKRHQQEAQIIAEAGKSGNVTIATNMAGRGTDIKLDEKTRESGGLAIVGTERHESRRIDRQLRGRAGRQGDPGSSQFFVSLEDDLMRLFGSERISKMMDNMGIQEGEVIQHKMISNSIEKAQKKVEENNFGIRKHLLEYDDVLNSQREVIYKKREHALYGERLDVDIANMIYDTCENVVNDTHGNVDYDEFKLELIRTLSIDSPITQEEYHSLSAEDITERIYEVVKDNYKHRVNTIAEQAMPVIKDVYNHYSQMYKDIVVPISDGNKVFRVIVNLENAYQSDGYEVMKDYEKTVMLMTIDDAWKEHLREMDELRQSVQNATYEQKDPLLVYKFESYELFRKMMLKINKDVISTLIKGRIYVEDSQQVQKAEEDKVRQDYSQLDTKKEDTGDYGVESSGGASKQKQEKAKPVTKGKKIGRNEQCPCGSGKKYKNCHGKPGAPQLNMDELQVNE